MTTFILPTKAEIQSYRATPAQLQRDLEVETFLSTVDNYQFLIALNQAWRNGFTSLTYTASSSVNAGSLFIFLTDPSYGYEYTVSAPVGSTITVSWA